MANEFVRSVEFLPAWDKRSDDPKKNYGIHGVEIRFVLRGEKGAFQFVLYTNWQLPHVMNERMGRWHEPIGGDLHWMERPQPADVGYHAYEPQYEGQERMGECHILTDAPGGCYYDGSSLQAEAVFKRLLAEGDAGVWAELESRYHSMFDTVAAGRPED